ncbi:MAG: bifunctional aspartate kinase/homoserine dehydrogenase I [Flammeovirgaceae bacterium]
MRLLKFGGTSVGSAQAIRQVKNIVADYRHRGISFAVTVSAMSGITNALIEAGKLASKKDEQYTQVLQELEGQHFDAVRELFTVQNQSRVIAQLKKMLNELEEILHGVSLLRELSPRTLDLIQSFGERMSAFFIAEFFTQEGIPSEMLDARDVIVTDRNFGSAKVDFHKTNTNIVAYFKNRNALQVITGFIGATPQGETTTLGRGGSDYTCAIFGAALNAEVIELWKEVDGVLTADPKVVKNAFSLSTMSYEEAMELSHFGAKVIYPPALQPALRKEIPLRILNTFNPTFEGTLISKEKGGDDLPLKGISSIKEIALINVTGSGMIGVAGVSSRLFGALGRHDISVILITQASSEHSICFALTPSEAKKAKEAIENEFEVEINAGKIDEIVVEEGVSIIALVGENMRNMPGVSGAVFSALGRNGVNVRAIAQGSSELNISVVIPQKDLSKALNALHEAFFLSELRTVNVFLVGVGLIGGTLLAQIHKQTDYLLKEHLLKINVVAIANSKRMVFDTNGLNIQQPKEELLEKGENTDLRHFVQQMKALNLPNSVFVDCTSSLAPIEYYEEILDASISISTPNKLACSGRYADYQRFTKTAIRRGVKFLHETNVGAGLPVINPLNDLKMSGDKIIKIEGILSGTLSYIFNNFTEGKKFSQIVAEAKQKGYTEPDPRDDLSGMDVARKILILSREAGFALEPEDVKVQNILPESCIKASSVEHFFFELEKANPYFEEIRANAAKNSKVLRFIAKLENHEATVSLHEVDVQHPFYHLSGSDNVIAFTTERYKERPLVIKGAGAGAEVTAAGVFAEIIMIGNYMGGNPIGSRPIR